MPSARYAIPCIAIFALLRLTSWRTQNPSAGADYSQRLTLSALIELAVSTAEDAARAAQLVGSDTTLDAAIRVQSLFVGARSTYVKLIGRYQDFSRSLRPATTRFVASRVESAPYRRTGVCRQRILRFMASGRTTCLLRASGITSALLADFPTPTS